MILMILLIKISFQKWSFSFVLNSKFQYHIHIKFDSLLLKNNPKMDVLRSKMITFVISLRMNYESDIRVLYRIG